MKNIIISIILVLALTLSLLPCKRPYYQKHFTKQQFQSYEQILPIVKKLVIGLNKNEQNSVLSLLYNKKLPDYIFKNLQDANRRYNYLKLINKQKYYIGSKRFTLGGHIYGHMHIIFRKKNNKWFIDNVFMCR